MGQRIVCMISEDTDIPGKFEITVSPSLFGVEEFDPADLGALGHLDVLQSELSIWGNSKMDVTVKSCNKDIQVIEVSTKSIDELNTNLARCMLFERNTPPETDIDAAYKLINDTLENAWSPTDFIRGVDSIVHMISTAILQDAMTTFYHNKLYRNKISDNLVGAYVLNSETIISAAKSIKEQTLTEGDVK